MKNSFLILFMIVSVKFYGIAQSTVTMQVDASNPTITISRHIYGHFAEHLGRCI